MSVEARLSKEQEDRRRAGLRLLARIIARHYIKYPERYGDERKAVPPAPLGPCNERGRTSDREER